MTIHAFPRGAFTTLDADTLLVLEIFRKLDEFREDYDEKVLEELAAILRARMSEREADMVMSDALVMDNELRFRLPLGMAFREAGTAFASDDERALVTMISRSRRIDDPIAAAAAERLGIAEHRILRQAASLLASSLARAGVEIDSGMAHLTPAAVDRPSYAEIGH